ncbi:MAG TPA: S8 family serine peptidase [Bacteriovoracaceae bacterium]|nr:S8 family serine peptidase [Bacteriovoracaceae bacterium]
MELKSSVSAIAIFLILTTPAFAINNLKSKLIPDSYIVVLDKGGDSKKDPLRPTKLKNKAHKVLDQHRISRGQARRFYTDVMGGFAAELTEEEADELRNDLSVLSVEKDQTYSISQTLSCPVPVSQPAQVMSWGARRIGYGPGTGKVAWVVDSGIDLCHRDLNVDKARSRSFVDNSAGQDGNGHGTHVAGIIGAKNNSIGTRGVASNTSLIAVKVLTDTGSSSGSSVLAGLDYVYQNVKSGEVVNLSLGGGASTIMDDAVKRIATKGAWVVIAAGNSGAYAGNVSPARANGPRIYTISAYSSGDYHTSWSNYGNPPVDYSLPGNSILSTYLKGVYASLSGTSMAAPHMAGLLLLTNGLIRVGGYVKNDPDGVPDRIAIK